MRLSVRSTPKEVNRKFRLKTKGLTGSMRDSSMPGLKKSPGMKSRNSSMPGLKKSPGMKSRGSIAKSLSKPSLSKPSLSKPSLSKARIKSQARTGMSRAHTGAARVQTGMHRTQTGAVQAIGWMVPASIAARRIASRQMTNARGWTAPRVERAAVYFNGSMAPKIGSALSGTAAWIEPPKRHRATRNTMVGTLAACLAGATVAMMMTRRRHQMQHLLEPEESLESERHSREQTLTGSYSPTGQSPSYGESGRGSAPRSTRPGNLGSP